jgi:transketolase
MKSKSEPDLPDFDIVKAPDMALKLLRLDILTLAERSGHVGCALSCVDIIAALYFGVLRVRPETQDDPARDRFILSKGHGCMALYAVLCRAGFFSRELLECYCHNSACLAEHPPSGKVPGVELAAGSLGHGLAFGAGVAKAHKLVGRDARVYVLLGDGECDEGSVWEAAAAASAHGLDNLIALVDLNGLQACAGTASVSPRVSLPTVWAGFGWHVVEVDGHDFASLQTLLRQPEISNFPLCIFCRTRKGAGIDFMENDLEWHYRPVSPQDRERARKVLFNA